MIVRAAKVRWTLLAGLVGLLAAGRAYAQTTCDTDLDCPDPACGGQVCQKSSGGSQCVAANTSGASGTNDGWCNGDDTKCKCHSLGATCNGFFCTFTIPPDGGASGGSGGGGGTGGSTGTGGSGTGGSGTAKGGSGGGTGGSGGGGGGCSVAGDASALGSAGATLLVAALVVRRRRRRRA